MPLTPKAARAFFRHRNHFDRETLVKKIDEAIKTQFTPESEWLMVALFDTPNTTEQDATLAEVKKLYEHAGWIVDMERKKKPCEMLVMVGLQEKPEEPKQAPYRVVVSIPHSVTKYDVEDLDEAEGRRRKEDRDLRDDYPELEGIGSIWIEKLSPAGIYEKVQP